MSTELKDLQSEFNKSVKNASYYVSKFIDILKFGLTLGRISLSTMFILWISYMIFNLVTFGIGWMIFVTSSPWLGFTSTTAVGMTLYSSYFLAGFLPPPIRIAFATIFRFTFSVIYYFLKKYLPVAVIDIITVYEFVKKIIDWIWNTCLKQVPVVEDIVIVTETFGKFVLEFTKTLFNFLVDMLRSLFKKIYDTVPDEYKGEMSVLNNLLDYLKEKKDDISNILNGNSPDTNGENEDDIFEYFDGELHINYNTNKTLEGEDTTKTFIKNGNIVKLRQKKKKIIKIKGSGGFKVDLIPRKDDKKKVDTKKKNEPTIVPETGDQNQVLNDEDLNKWSKNSVFEYDKLKLSVEKIIKNHNNLDTNVTDSRSDNVDESKTSFLKLFDAEKFLMFTGQHKHLIEFRDFLSDSTGLVLKDINAYFEKKNKTEKSDISMDISVTAIHEGSIWDTGDEESNKNAFMDTDMSSSSSSTSSQFTEKKSEKIPETPDKPNLLVDETHDQIYNFLLTIFTDDELKSHSPENIKPTDILNNYFSYLEKSDPKVLTNFSSSYASRKSERTDEIKIIHDSFLTKTAKIVLDDDLIESDIKESIRANELSIPINFEPIFSKINFVSDAKDETIAKFMALVNISHRSLNHVFAEQSMYLSNNDVSELNNTIMTNSGLLSEYLTDEFSTISTQSQNYSGQPPTTTASTFTNKQQSISELEKKLKGSYKYPFKNIKRPTKFFTDVYKKDRDLISQIFDDESEPYTSGPPSLFFQFGVAYVSDIKRNISKKKNVVQKVDKEFWEISKKRHKENMESKDKNDGTRNLFLNKKNDKNIITIIRLFKFIQQELYDRPSEQTEPLSSEKYTNRWFRLIKAYSTVKPTFSNSYIKELNRISVNVRPEDLPCGFNNHFMTNSNVTEGSLDNNYKFNSTFNSIKEIFNVATKQNDSYIKKISILNNGIKEINLTALETNSDLVIQNYLFSDPYLENPKNSDNEYIITNTLYSRSLMMKHPVDFFASVNLPGKGGDVLTIDNDTIEKYSAITEKIKFVDSQDKTHKTYFVEMDLVFIMTDKNIVINSSDVEYNGFKKNVMQRDTKLVKIKGSKVVLQYVKSINTVAPKANELERYRNLYSVSFIIDIQSMYRTFVNYDIIHSFGIYKSPISRWTKLYSYHVNTTFSGKTSYGNKNSRMTIENMRPQSRFIFTTFMDTIDKLNIICLSLFKGYSIAYVSLDQFLKFHKKFVAKDKVSAKEIWTKFEYFTKKLVEIINFYSKNFQIFLEYVADPWKSFKEIADSILIDRTFENNWIEQMKPMTPNLVKFYALGKTTKTFVSTESLMLLERFLAYT